MAFMSAPVQKADLRHRAGKIWKHPLTWLAAALLFSLVLVLVVALLVAWTPGWYAPLPADNQHIMNLADRAERTLLQLRNQIGNPARKIITWSITQNEINSLLADRYAAPPTAGSSAMFVGPFVRLTHGKITLAIRDMNLPFHSVASVTIAIRTLQKGPNASAEAEVRLESVHIGLVPVPRAKVLGALHQRLKEIAPLIRQTLGRYAGSRYARSETPQVLKYLQHAMQGRPFPLTLPAGGRTLELERISVHAAGTSASGRVEPARITLILKQISA